MRIIRFWPKINNSCCFRYDQNWWIGRKVQIGCDIGFIPSPAKLETLRIQNAQNKTNKIYANKQNSSANLTKFLQKKSNEIKDKLPHTNANSDGEMDDEEAEAKKKAELHEEPPPTQPSLVEQERKKKGLLGRKVSFCNSIRILQCGKSCNLWLFSVNLGGCFDWERISADALSAIIAKYEYQWMILSD